MERESASLEGKYIDFVYHGAVFERMNALADSEKAYAIRMYQVLKAVFLHSSAFTVVSEYSQLKSWWVENGAAFQCSAGTVFFGIDTYNLFGDMITDDEREWSVWAELTTQNLEQLCNEIARAIQETIKIKVYWEVKNNINEDSMIRELHLSHKQGFVEVYSIIDENGHTQFRYNNWDEADVEEI